MTPSLPSVYPIRRLFLISVLALVATGIGFSIRGNIAGSLQAELFDPIDKLRSAEMVATVLGVVFLGFAFTMAIGSPMLDYLGMGRLLAVASGCLVTGNLVVIFSPELQGSIALFRVVWWKRSSIR